MTAPEEPRPKIAVVDYDMGNRASVTSALRAVGADPVVTRDESQLRAAAGLVLPGVGAYPAAMEKIRRYGLDAELDRARRAGTPLLGICLGHQLLFESSDEHSITPGLGFVAGAVRKVLPGPHSMNVGWRDVAMTREIALNQGIPSMTPFYHLHSYAVTPEDDSVIFARSDYEIPKGDISVRIVSGIQSGNLYGVQFHPEKSSQDGLDLLKRFVEISTETAAEL